MKGPYTTAPGEGWSLTEDTYVFSGTPQECRGELSFVNDCDHKIKIRSLTTQVSKRSRKGQSKLPATALLVNARVPAHGQCRAIAQLQLPAQTPPGHYFASIGCGERSIHLDIEVLGYHDFLVEPSHAQVHAQAGETIRLQLTLSNLGNLPIDLSDVGMIWLRERDWIGRTLVYTLRETAAEDNYEDFCNRLLKNFRSDVIAPARIQFETGGEALLGVGQVLQRILCLKLPLGLKKGRRYLGFIKINDDRIWLEVYCTGDRVKAKSTETETTT